MKSFAKVNIFLKITGKRENYHTLISRFMLVKNLYDEITFIESKKKKFNIEGNFSCELEKNTIYKAYKLLLEYTQNPKLIEFFENHSVKVIKNIPEGSGLGGGSSNCASFLKLTNKELNLNLSKEELSKIGSKIGADVAFFIYDYEVANISGIGETVEKVNEKALNLKVFTPKIECNTAKVYQNFRANFYKELENQKIEEFKNLNSMDIFNRFKIEDANDLYYPALELYPNLKEYAKEPFLFSGSGSSFFKLL